ncbi:hypothetical protein COB72_06495 [bacterium]|nr:MAG: hypothetical protein COB72_06495 [bacterium]
MILTRDQIEKRFTEWHDENRGTTSVCVRIRSSVGKPMCFGRNPEACDRKLVNQSPDVIDVVIGPVSISKEGASHKHKHKHQHQHQQEGDGIGASQNQISHNPDEQFVIRVMPRFQRRNSSNDKKENGRQFGPEVESNTPIVCEQCTRETVDIIKQIDAQLKDHATDLDRKNKSRFNWLMCAIAFSTLVATVAAIGPIAGMFLGSDGSDQVQEEQQIEPVGLLLKLPIKSFNGMPMPITDSTPPPSVGDEMKCGLNSIPSGQRVISVTVEGSRVYTQLGVSEKWPLSDAGSLTMIALTFEPSDDTWVDEQAEETGLDELMRAIENSLFSKIELPAPEVAGGMHLHWVGQGFEFREGAVPRGPGGGGESSFHDWATVFVDTVQGVMDDAGYSQWAWVGHSFTVKP